MKFTLFGLLLAFSGFHPCHSVTFNWGGMEESRHTQQNTLFSSRQSSSPVQPDWKPLNFSTMFSNLFQQLNSTMNDLSSSLASAYPPVSANSVEMEEQSSNLVHHVSGSKDVFDEIVRLIFSFPSRKLTLLQPFAANIASTAGHATKSAARISSKAAHNLPAAANVKADILKAVIKAIGDKGGSLLTILSGVLNAAADAKLSTSHTLPHILSILANVKGQVGNTLAEGVIGAKQVVHSKGKLVANLIHGGHGSHGVKKPTHSTIPQNTGWASSVSNANVPKVNLANNNLATQFANSFGSTKNELNESLENGSTSGEGVKNQDYWDYENTH